MVIEVVGALSLPVWLCVEEVMRLREKSSLQAAESAPPAPVERAGVLLVRAPDAV